MNLSRNKKKWTKFIWKKSLELDFSMLCLLVFSILCSLCIINVPTILHVFFFLYWDIATWVKIVILFHASILCLPRKGTTIYLVWQFESTIRSVVFLIVGSPVESWQSVLFWICRKIPHMLDRKSSTVR